MLKGDDAIGANHVAEYLELEWLLTSLVGQAKNNNVNFVVSSLKLITEIIHSDHKEMNLMLSKFKLIDILAMCWN